MGQPSSSCAPSYALNSTLRPRVVQQIHPKVHLADEEATCMPVRIASFLTWGNRRRLLLFGALLVFLFISAAGSLAQTVAHSPGWVVLPVEEYRTLHARAYPTERDRSRLPSKLLSRGLTMIFASMVNSLPAGRASRSMS